MTRVNTSVTTRKRHNKIIKMAKGYQGRNKNCFRVAIEKVEKALQYAYRDRRTKKRNFRSLWIQRINAAVRLHGMTYSQFMNGMRLANINLNRKILADIAIRNPENFSSIAAEVKKVLDKKAV